jgi:phage-related protein
MPLPIFPNVPPLADSEQDDSEILTDLAWFGGGARQEIEAGLNSEVTIGRGPWHRSKADIDIIVAFLQTSGVSGFQFTPPPTGEMANFRCISRKRRETTSDSDRLDCTFEQIFRKVGGEAGFIGTLEANKNVLVLVVGKQFVEHDAENCSKMRYGYAAEVASWRRAYLKENPGGRSSARQTTADTKAKVRLSVWRMPTPNR